MPDMTTPASEREMRLREQIAGYVEAVKLIKGWRNRDIAAAVGYTTPAQVSKVVNQKHTMGADKLLRLERATGLPIPDPIMTAISLPHTA